MKVFQYLRFIIIITITGNKITGDSRNGWPRTDSNLAPQNLNSSYIFGIRAADIIIII